MALTTCTGDTYVEYIDPTECIGNSLEKINSNFGLVDSALCEMSTLFNAMGSVTGVIWSNGDSTFREAIQGADSTADYYKPGTPLTSLDITLSLNCLGKANIGGDLYSAGTIYARQDVIAFSSSDKRLKKDITLIEEPLKKLEEIKGVTFKWNEELQTVHKGNDVGVIAQDVQKVLPECVAERENGFLAVRYEKLVPLLIESIKELKKEVESLKAELKK